MPAHACLIVYPANTAILLIFHAMVTKFHSPRTEPNPRNRNCRKPITDLIMPNTGSNVCFTDSQNKPELNVWRQLNFSNGPCFGLLKSAQLPIMFNPVGLAMPIPGLLDSAGSAPFYWIAPARHLSLSECEIPLYGNTSMHRRRHPAVDWQAAVDTPKISENYHPGARRPPAIFRIRKDDFLAAATMRGTS